MTEYTPTASIDWLRLYCRVCGGLLEPVQQFAHCPACRGLLVSLGPDEMQQLRHYRQFKESLMSDTQTRSPAKHKRPRKTAKPKKQTVTVEHSEHEIPIAKIVVAHNDRQHFDDESLRMLAESIKLDGVLAPLLVRPAGVAKADGPDYELVAGERRLRAAQIAMLDTVPCRVRVLDDATVARMRLAENFFREDLNPIEEAEAFRKLCDEHGFSQRELADQFGLSQGKIGNAVRLLKLPPEWQQRVISGEITATQGRELATWADCPAVLAKVGQYLEDDRTETLLEWRDTILMAARDVSRPLKGREWDDDARRMFDAQLTPTERKREDLDVREVPNPYRPSAKPEKRAFNVELWKELVQAGEERRRARQEAPATEEASHGTTGTTGAQLTPAEARAKAAQKKEAWEKKLTRYYYGWLKDQVVFELESLVNKGDALFAKLAIYFACKNDNPYSRGGVLADVVQQMGGREKKGRYYGTDVWGTLGTLKHITLCEEARDRAIVEWFSHEDHDLALVQDLAGELEIALESHWVCDREFLELHTKDQLGELAKEWKTTVPLDKRDVVIAALMARAEEVADAGQPFPPPKALTKIAKKPAAL